MRHIRPCGNLNFRSCEHFGIVDNLLITQNLTRSSGLLSYSQDTSHNIWPFSPTSHQPAPYLPFSPQTLFGKQVTFPDNFVPQSRLCRTNLRPQISYIFPILAMVHQQIPLFVDNSGKSPPKIPANHKRPPWPKSKNRGKNLCPVPVFPRGFSLVRLNRRAKRLCGDTLQYSSQSKKNL